jgi:hypothetical protein
MVKNQIFSSIGKGTKEGDNSQVKPQQVIYRLQK